MIVEDIIHTGTSHLHLDGLNGLSWKTLVIEDNGTVNAWCLIGKIIVSSGLF